MLCLLDPLAVRSSLSVLVMPVSSTDGIHVGWSIGIENSHIHKAAFRLTPPKTILGVCCRQGKRVRVTHRLQLRFNLNLVAHLIQQTSSVKMMYPWSRMTPLPPDKIHNNNNNKLHNNSNIDGKCNLSLFIINFRSIVNEKAEFLLFNIINPKL